VLKDHIEVNWENRQLWLGWEDVEAIFEETNLHCFAGLVNGNMARVAFNEGQYLALDFHFIFGDVA
jgi:hypothetical protein